MKKVCLIFSFLLLSLLSFRGFSQEISDSLLLQIDKTPDDTNKINLLLGVANSILYSDPDSSRYFFNEAVELSWKLDDSYFLASSISAMAISYAIQGDFDYSLELWDESLNLLDSLLNIDSTRNYIIKQKAATVNNIGGVYHYMGKYDKAMEYYLISLRIEEKLKNYKGMADGYSNLGLIHSDIALSIGGESAEKEYLLSIEFNQQALAMKKILNDEIGMATSYNNIGLVYESIKQYDSALVYYDKSRILYEKLDQKLGLSAVYSNLGNIYDVKAQYDNAIASFKKALNVAEEMNDRSTLSTVYNNLSSVYVSLADSTALSERQKKHYFQEVVKFAKKAYDLAVETGSYQLQLNSSGNLKRAYMELEQFENAYYYAEMHTLAKDSMFSDDKTRSLAEMETKYQTEKKQIELDKEKQKRIADQKALEAEQEKSRKQQIIIFSSVGGFFIVLIFSVIILRMFRQKKRANILLASQNDEISQQKEEITSQRDEIMTQRDRLQEQNKRIEELYNVAVERKEIVEKQKEEIDDSIQYAKRIQSAVLPEKSYSNEVLGEHFILFRPKDVVSGDFFWLKKTSEWTIVTVADCTGHGVPGAFMSMLGISFLNEIVVKKDVVNTADILNQLRNSVIEALRQQGDSDEAAVKDGMDMSLLAIRNDRRKAMWSGANNPLWIMRSGASEKEYEDSADLVEVIKGDTMPVAIHPKMTDFTYYELDLNKDDRLFLFSDGFPDQFGGPKGKKYKYKTFRRLLAETSALNMAEQYAEILTALDMWQNFEGRNYEQVDDITVVGIKV